MSGRLGAGACLEIVEGRLLLRRNQQLTKTSFPSALHPGKPTRDTRTLPKWWLASCGALWFVRPFCSQKVALLAATTDRTLADKPSPSSSPSTPCGFNFVSLTVPKRWRDTLTLSWFSSWRRRVVTLGRPWLAKARSPTTISRIRSKSHPLPQICRFSGFWRRTSPPQKSLILSFDF